MLRLASLANLIFVFAVCFGMKFKCVPGFMIFFFFELFLPFVVFATLGALCNDLLILLPFKNESYLLQI